eukprot:CAMPEP_0174877780 /NCGR_PEP_ID=MMETSP1114-20130205/82430_1 /TAXON_ID=312471 /ORGANISM="Neobodo designis, Strain CCAP 1951/1" /LENGTH=421 /DNA_ID=CAMNT_0016113167 /DNA_START=144 /DNA_END=1409 /DNA_ORIENTATION=-
MVNGPRPAKLLHPAGNSASPNNGTTPARSPLFLQRQTTSVYSTVTSTGTPVLVYGKAATPIAGAWSAEPWNPEDVAGTPLPGALEDPHATHDEAHDEAPEQPHEDADDVSSVAETAAFTDTDTRSPVQATAPAMPTSEEQPQTTQQPKHVAFKYRFDPYAPSGAQRRETYRCDCEACIDAQTLGSDRLIGATYDATSYYASNGEGFDRYNTGETMAYTGDMNDDATSAAGMSWAATAEVPAAGNATSTPFIPPPPPPRIARGIMAESAEESLDVDAAFYHIAMRWYTKAAAVQAKFLPSADDFCPEPSEDTPFDEWVHAAGRWWLRHFEHAQVKSSPSSGLLRTAPAPTSARASESAGGFETHTTVNESYANHRHALRSGPRKAFGSSNLTASMLANLGSKTSALPAPRSSTNTRLESLPW